MEDEWLCVGGWVGQRKLGGKCECFFCVLLCVFYNMFVSLSNLKDKSKISETSKRTKIPMGWGHLTGKDNWVRE